MAVTLKNLSTLRAVVSLVTGNIERRLRAGRGLFRPAPKSVQRRNDNIWPYVQFGCRRTRTAKRS